MWKAFLKIIIGFAIGGLGGAMVGSAISTLAISFGASFPVSLPLMAGGLALVYVSKRLVGSALKDLHGFDSDRKFDRPPQTGTEAIVVGHNKAVAVVLDTVTSRVPPPVVESTICKGKTRRRFFRFFRGKAGSDKSVQ
jgi:hypothetical protein